MSVRRSRRLNSQLPDASFQIPFGVDASSNNLLLEGDSTLQNEFFGDATDITMSTPLASRPPTSRRGLRTRTPRRHPLAEATVQEELDENDEVPNDLEATPKAHNGTRTFGFPRFPLPSTITQFSTKPPDTMFQDTNPAINDFYPVYPCTPKRSPTASMPLPEYFTPAPVRIPMPSPSPQSVIIPSAALERTTTPLSPVVNPATGDGPSTSDISNLPAQVRPTTEVDPTPIQVDQISTPSKLQRPMKPVRKSLRQSLRSSSPVKLPEANDKAEVSSIPRLRSKARASSARRKVSEKTNPIQNPAPSGALEENRCKTDYCATVDVPSLHPVPESGESLEQQPEEPDREINLANLRLHDSLEKGDGDDFACGGAAVSAMRESVPTHVMNYAPSPSEHRVVTPKDEGDNLALPGTTAMKRMADETDDAGIHAPTDQSSSRSNVRDRGTKKARLDGDAHAAAGPSTLSRPAPSLPRKSMIQSQTHRRVSGRRLSHSDSRKLLGKSRARPTVSRRDPALRRPRPAGTTAKEAARSVSAKKTSTVATASNVKPKPEWDSGPGTSCGLTIPTAPAFHSDLLRQQRLLAKADQRKGKPDDEDTDTKNVSKSKVTKPPTTTDNACVRPPLIDRKVSQNAIGIAASRPKLTTQKPTIPHTFHFESDLRLNLRKQAIEKKTEDGGLLVVSGPGASQRIIPNFQTYQAELAAKRKEVIAPTVPHSPKFVLDMRLAEREKFEERRKEKEMEILRQEEERKKAMEEEEERAWREARKMTVPRANAVPEWYASVQRKEGHA